MDSLGRMLVGDEIWEELGEEWEVYGQNALHTYNICIYDVLKESKQKTGGDCVNMKALVRLARTYPLHRKRSEAPAPGYSACKTCL